MIRDLRSVSLGYSPGARLRSRGRQDEDDGIVNDSYNIASNSQSGNIVPQNQPTSIEDEFRYAANKNRMQQEQSRAAGRWPEMPTGPDIYAPDYGQDTSPAQQQNPQQQQQRTMPPMYDRQMPIMQSPLRVMQQEPKRGAWDFAEGALRSAGEKFGGIGGGIIGGALGGPGGAVAGKAVGGALAPGLGGLIGRGVKKVGGWLSKIPVIGKITDGIGNFLGSLFGGGKKKERGTKTIGAAAYANKSRSYGQAYTPGNGTTGHYTPGY